MPFSRPIWEPTDKGHNTGEVVDFQLGLRSYIVLCYTGPEINGPVCCWDHHNPTSMLRPCYNYAEADHRLDVCLDWCSDVWQIITPARRCFKKKNWRKDTRRTLNKLVIMGLCGALIMTRQWPLHTPYYRRASLTTPPPKKYHTSIIIFFVMQMQSLEIPNLLKLLFAWLFVCLLLLLFFVVVVLSESSISLRIIHRAVTALWNYHN